MKPLWKSTEVFVVLVAGLILGTVAFAQGPGEPDQLDATIDANARTEAIHGLVKDLREVYVFPDTGDKVADMLEQHLKTGDYNSITSAKEFATTLTKQMRDIAQDQHLKVIYSAALLPREDQQGSEPGSEAPRIEMLKKTNYGFEEVKRLDGNIGYLKLSGFKGAVNGGPTVAGAMAFLANTDAMIIDLRDNRGGSPGMVELIASYFFSGERSVHLNDLALRNKGTRDYHTTQWWVLPSVPGQRYVDKEVYILTAHRTFSGAEEFTYDMQAQKRATIVGETTEGGANPGSDMRIGDHFAVFMPYGHAINPITHTNWEHEGVKPDVEVPAADAMKTAEKMALDHLIAKSTDPQDQGALKRALDRVEGPSEEQKQ